MLWFVIVLAVMSFFVVLQVVFIFWQLIFLESQPVPLLMALLLLLPPSITRPCLESSSLLYSLLGRLKVWAISCYSVVCAVYWSLPFWHSSLTLCCLWSPWPLWGCLFLSSAASPDLSTPNTTMSASFLFIPWSTISYSVCSLSTTSDGLVSHKAPLLLLSVWS